MYKTVLTFRQSKDGGRVIRQFSGPFDSLHKAFSRAYKFADKHNMINVAIIDENNNLCFLIEGDYTPHIYNIEKEV